MRARAWCNADGSLAVPNLKVQSEDPSLIGLVPHQYFWHGLLEVLLFSLANFYASSFLGQQTSRARRLRHFDVHCHSHGVHRRSAATLYGLFTESRNVDLSFLSAYMLRILIKTERTLQSLFWCFSTVRNYDQSGSGWTNIGHYINWTSPVDIHGWICVRRYFLQGDRWLRVTDVESFHGPDRLLHSACMLRCYGLQSSYPFPCSQWNRLTASIDHTINLSSWFRLQIPTGSATSSSPSSFF